MWARGIIQRKRRTEKKRKRRERIIILALLESREDYGKLVWTYGALLGRLPRTGLDTATKDRKWEIVDAPDPDYYEHRSLFFWSFCLACSVDYYLSVSVGLLVVCMVIPRGYHSDRKSVV